MSWLETRVCVCHYMLDVLQTPRGMEKDTISPFLCQNILIISSSKYCGSVTKELTLMHVLINLQTLEMRLTKILRKGWQLILHRILHLIPDSVMSLVVSCQNKLTVNMLCNVNTYLHFCVYYHFLSWFFSLKFW